MPATKLISVKCGGCGQVYRVPPEAAEQRAKCRPCGHEFLIPAAPANQRGKSETSAAPGQAAADRFAAAEIASVCSRRPRLRFWSFRKRLYLTACLAASGLLAAILYHTLSSPDQVIVKDLQRGRVAKLSPPRSELEYASIAELVEAVEPSVVQVETSTGFGSGFVLDESGLVVTCHHCIDNVMGATVVFSDGRRIPVLGAIKASPECDLVVLAIDPSGPLVPLPLAKRTPKKGDPIVAFGSPGGLSFSISEGSVSGLRTAQDLKDLPGVFRTVTGLSPNVALVQITASVMPGNSGGPVVDFSGNVIGISSFVLNWQGQMYEFCISAEEIRNIVAYLDQETTPLWQMNDDGLSQATY